MIERVPLEAFPSNNAVSDWIGIWRILRDQQGWETQLLTVQEKHGPIYKVVALIGMGCKP